MKKIMLFVCFAFISVAASGCSTVEGMGKDISKAGDAIQETF